LLSIKKSCNSLVTPQFAQVLVFIQGLVALAICYAEVWGVVINIVEPCPSVCPLMGQGLDGLVIRDALGDSDDEPVGVGLLLASAPAILQGAADDLDRVSKRDENPQGMHCVVELFTGPPVYLHHSARKTGLE